MLNCIYVCPLFIIIINVKCYWSYSTWWIIIIIWIKDRVDGSIMTTMAMVVVGLPENTGQHTVGPPLPEHLCVSWITKVN